MAIKKIVVKNIGACLIRIEKQDLKPDDVLEVSEAQVNSQAFKYLFLRKELEFEDDPKRTREYIAEIKKAAKVKPEKEVKDIEDLETGKEYK